MPGYEASWWIYNTFIRLCDAVCDLDIDECSTSNGGCAQNCINLDGGHTCSCREGFVLGEDNKTCDDVNECLVELCTHACVNTPGGFHCVCGQGYSLAEDGTSCNGNTTGLV